MLKETTPATTAAVSMITIASSNASLPRRLTDALRNSHLERLHGAVRIAPKADRFSAAVQRFLDGRCQHEQILLEAVQVAFEVLRHKVIRIGR